MENTVYYLKTCDTNKRIMKDLGLNTGFILREIKSNQITPSELDEMKDLAGSYAALFSKRSRQFGALGLQDKSLEEKDFKELILKEYTFLKRPVTIFNDEIFIGNAKSEIDRLRAKL
ncbi:MAG: arsenate reductase [Salibacteraceae bacterium]|jgi:arsenate reductase